MELRLLLQMLWRCEGSSACCSGFGLFLFGPDSGAHSGVLLVLCISLHPPDEGLWVSTRACLADLVSGDGVECTHTLSLSLVVYCAVQYKQWVYTWSICQSNLQVVQRKLQRNPGPDTYTHNTQTGHIQRLVLEAHYNLGSTKSSLSLV